MSSKNKVKFAKKIIREGMKNPLYKMESYETDKGVSLFFMDNNGEYVSLNYSGIYSIYRKVNDKYECLYVGETDYSIYGRIHRWVKGVAGKLRDDESHSGATKAREDGITLDDELYVKVIDSDTVYMIWKNFTSNLDVATTISMSCQSIDEWIAPLLKSKYNTITFEETASLEDFFA
jgi:hypothetical protein